MQWGRRRRRKAFCRSLTPWACISPGLSHTTALSPSDPYCSTSSVREGAQTQKLAERAPKLCLPPSSHHSSRRLVVNTYPLPFPSSPSHPPAQLPGPALLRAARSSAWPPGQPPVDDHPAGWSFNHHFSAGYIMVRRRLIMGHLG